MMVINMFAYHHVNNDQDNSKEAIADRNFIKTLLIELIAGSLNAFLLPIYTYKQEDSILQYFALPAGESKYFSFFFCHQLCFHEGW